MPSVAAQRENKPLCERNNKSATDQTKCGKAKFQLSASVPHSAPLRGFSVLPRRSENQTANINASAALADGLATAAMVLGRSAFDVFKPL